MQVGVVLVSSAPPPEVAAFVEQFKDELDEHGRRLVVRNGFHAEREVTTAAGAIPVRTPRINDKRVDEATDERKRYSSAILHELSSSVPPSSPRTRPSAHNCSPGPAAPDQDAVQRP